MSHTVEPGCHGSRGHDGQSLRTRGRAPPWAKAVGAPGVGAGPALGVGGSHWVPSLFADTATAAAAPQGRCQLGSRSRRRARRGERAAARPGRNPRPRTAAPPGAQKRAVTGRAGPTAPPTPRSAAALLSSHPERGALGPGLPHLQPPNRGRRPGRPPGGQGPRAGGVTSRGRAGGQVWHALPSLCTRPPS